MKQTLHKQQTHNKEGHVVRHLQKLKDDNRLLFMAFVFLIAASVIINTAYILNNGRVLRSSNSPATVSADTGKVLTSLQTGVANALTVKIGNVTENDSFDYTFTPEAGTTMLICSVTVTNNTAATQHLLPVNQFYVRSDEGDYAALHASMYVTKQLAAADLAPGKTATGQLSFSIPKRVAHPLLYVDTGWDKTTPIVFDVLR